jgi:hypothetical protein
MVESDNVGEGIRFERLRRITGYISKYQLLDGTTQFNDAKYNEVKDREKHDQRI